MNSPTPEQGHTVPAGELVKAGLCTPQCLLAGGAHGEACRCRCDGSWHGALADALIEVNADLRPWWERCHRAGWGLSDIETYVPVCNTAKRRNDLWKHSKAQRKPYLMVNQSQEGWRVIHDHATVPYRLGEFGHTPSNGWLVDGAGDLGLRFTAALFSEQRIRGAGPPPGEHVFLYGIRSQEEAQMIGLLLGECFAGNHSGIIRAICVLEGHQDPCEQGLMPKSYLAGLPTPSYPWLRPADVEETA